MGLHGVGASAETEGRGPSWRPVNTPGAFGQARPGLVFPALFSQGCRTIRESDRTVARIIVAPAAGRRRARKKNNAAR